MVHQLKQYALQKTNLKPKKINNYMKKIFLCIITSFVIGNLFAQDNSMNNSNAPVENNNIDSLLPRFCIDVNLKLGIQNQNLTTINFLNAFTSPSNSTISNPNYTNGSTVGFDIQGGYFFGKKRNWGIGTGFMYLSQMGTLTMDNYKIQYQSSSAVAPVFTQIIGSNQSIKETINTTNMNIPLVVKYKHQLGKKLGIAVDAGILYNMQIQNNYTTNASFDYEAIVPEKINDAYVYNLLITKAEISKTDPNNVAKDFLLQHSLGYNVGLGVKPTSTSGTVSYTSGSIGLLLKPSLSYRVSKSVYLDLGVYFISQTFKNAASNTYMLTNKLGDYSSMMNSATSVTQTSMGLNLGARFYFYPKDRDKDGIPDRKDECPDVFGLKQFNGCPDTDGDGIPDKNDSCPTEFGLAKFNGCPDRDGDGIIDKFDRCPDQPGLAKFKGCPDKDGDGIPDIDDKCPDVYGLAQFNGCPDTDGDGIPDAEDSCPTVKGPLSNHGCPIEAPKPQVIEKIDISAPILFDVNKTTVQEVSKPILQEAAIEIKENKDAFIEVHGYTDTTGTKAYNQALSVRRAQAVKNELTKMGVNPKKVKTIGHGYKDPAAPNSTPEGRLQNRRGVMKLNQNKK